MNQNRIVFLLTFAAVSVVLAILFGQKVAEVPLQTTLTAVVILGAGVTLFRGVDPKGLSQLQYIYYVCFLLVLVINWSPSKAAAYVTPMLCIGLFVVYYSVLKNSRYLSQTFMIAAVFFVVAFTYKTVYRDFVPQNAIITFFTYSSFIPLLIIPSKELYTRELYLRMASVMKKVLLLQSVVGLIQGMYGLHLQGALARSAGDWVEGTLHLPLSAHPSLNNVIYAHNMIYGIVFLIPYVIIYKKRCGVTLALSAAALVVGAAVHMVLIFCVAIAGSYILVRPFRMPGYQKYAKLFNGAFVIGMIGMSLAFFPIFKTIPGRIDNVRTGQNNKVKMYTDFFGPVQQLDPEIFWAGAGPGQMGSRACTIAAGYLGGLPPGFKYIVAPPFQKYLLADWIAWLGKYWKGRENSPESSWFAIMSEFGIVSFLVLMACLARFYFRTCGDFIRNKHPIHGFCWSIVFLVVVLSGYVNFYWEVPQCIFTGCLAFKMFMTHRYPDHT